MLTANSICSVVFFPFKFSHSRLQSRRAFSSANVFSCFLGFFFKCCYSSSGLTLPILFILEKKIICIKGEVYFIAWLHLLIVFLLLRNEPLNKCLVPSPLLIFHSFLTSCPHKKTIILFYLASVGFCNGI